MSHFRTLRHALVWIGWFGCLAGSAVAQEIELESVEASVESPWECPDGGNLRVTRYIDVIQKTTVAEVHTLRPNTFICERNGTRHGPTISWYENGQRATHSSYLFGLRHGKEWTWGLNGQVLRETEWRWGQAHGQHTEWYPDGQIRSITQWRDGRLHGRRISWFETGEIQSISNWLNHQILDGTDWIEKTQLAAY